MPNIAVVLKQEVSRLARKEIRSQAESFRKAAAQSRRAMAAMKRRLAELERRIASLEKRTPDGAARVNADSATGARFSAKWLSAHRKRLGLSAADYGKLLGVTGWSVYGWEHGKARPRQQQLAALVAVRSLGKREIKARLKGKSK
ncbi:MAG: hypothetical protein A3K19_31465 [Lentisphaerae bacterium RIFOXYB12_FULL_65_16]|nr:MAG: hypothetical protein A3K18_34430 [Lentisphaerae bacterium RIFOXYA12_64_32]OGV88563.1 MAG: hypothetical protein A3K19_31465 [Lentisphaerae bacterium RIFOXYB12_FULL_65_16]